MTPNNNDYSRLYSLRQHIAHATHSCNLCTHVRMFSRPSHSCPECRMTRLIRCLLLPHTTRMHALLATQTSFAACHCLRGDMFYLDHEHCTHDILHPASVAERLGQHLTQPKVTKTHAHTHNHDGREHKASTHSTHVRTRDTDTHARHGHEHMAWFILTHQNQKSNFLNK
jgi:hypothetical protein